MATAIPARLQALSSPEQIKSHLSEFMDRSRVLVRPIDLIAFASDASFYRLVPQAVVLAASEKEVGDLFCFSHRHGIPLTFRAAGTSLSGQAVSDGLLVEIARNFRGVEVLESGQKIRVQPGVIGANANRVLAPYLAKIGPDPASIATCTLGGILSNNSSGMCCGVEQNAYHTLASIRFMLPSGTVIDTAAPDADEEFRTREPKLAQGVLELKSRITANPPLAEKIRRKYRTKNTTGYSLNAFLDYERAVDIFAHLLIGAEGTLAFIAEAVLNTVADLPVKYTGLLLFPDLFAASEAIVPLRQAGAKALEIMDRASLRSVESQAGTPASIRGLAEDAAGLLVEFQAARESERAGLEDVARQSTAALKLLEPAGFTHEAATQAALWKIRSGMFPSVGSVRQSGTTVIIEDVAFPVEHLAPAAKDLTGLFRKHDYDNAIIFGHAKDGNLHFVITQSFNSQSAVDQYARFVDDVVELVVHKFDGALKAEHGTGRNMAPFVETEWGGDAYQIMRELKRLADPLNLLNPGVIINPDPRAHLAELKQLPTVESEIDKCIECGYCEPRCPSRELTLTPRQRIVVRREMTRQRNSGGEGDAALLAALEKDFRYLALDTCAADGLCATTCPVSIDTGSLVKRLRALSLSPRAKRVTAWTAQNFALVETAIRWALEMAHLAERIIGFAGVRAVSQVLRRVLGEQMAEWTPEMPFAAEGGVPATSHAAAQAVYFPSCISRVMGHLPGEPAELSLMEALLVIAERAGIPLHVPEDVAGLCCGTPYSSKGFEEAHAMAVNATIQRMWEWSHGGRLPVIVDTSPCTYGLQHSRHALTLLNQQRFDQLRIVDSIEFVHDELLPKLKLVNKEGSVALHPVCSVTKMGLAGKLEGIARWCAHSAFVPPNAGCCGFAGDRGFLVPELTAAATRLETIDILGHKHDGCYSSSRTCEIGMTRSTGEVYRSFIYLVEKVTRPAA